MRLLLLISITLFSLTAQAQAPKLHIQKVDEIGPYRLGSDYSVVKDLPGFKYDSGRSNPGKGIRAGKIIDKNVYDQPTIQRLIFHRDKLVRVSIIIGNPDFTEEQAKNLVAKEWGDPGPKQKIGNDLLYKWKGSIGMIVILAADGGRQMISLIDNDNSHFVE